MRLLRHLWTERIVSADVIRIDPAAEWKGRVRLNLSKQVLTFTEWEVPPHMASFGMAWAGGSLTLDSYFPSLLSTAYKGPVAELDLACNDPRDMSRPNNIAIQLALDHSRDELVKILGGPYGSREVEYAALCRLVKELYNASKVHGELPVYGNVSAILHTYALQQNGAWGLFYAEFFRIVNFILREHRNLFNEEVGFKWAHNKEGCPVIESDCDVRNRKYLAMVDVVFEFISTVVECTPCLREPVGGQNLFWSLCEEIHRDMEKVVSHLCSPKDSWIGGCNPSSGKKEKRTTTTKARGICGMTWRRLRTMILNLAHMFRHARFTTTCIINVVCQLPGQKGLSYDRKTVQLAKAEAEKRGQSNAGHLLRVAETKSCIRQGRDPHGAWVPFDFKNFCLNLCIHTRVAVSDYFPPIVQLRLRLQHYTRRGFSVADYLHAWKFGFGLRHRPFLEELLRRMTSDFKNRPIDLHDNNIAFIHYDPELNYAYRPLHMRIFFNGVKGAIPNSDRDYLRSEGTCDSFYAGSIYDMMSHDPGSAIVVEREIRKPTCEPSQWQPYNPPPLPLHAARIQAWWRSVRWRRRRSAKPSTDLAARKILAWARSRLISRRVEANWIRVVSSKAASALARRLSAALRLAALIRFSNIRRIQRWWRAYIFRTLRKMIEQVIYFDVSLAPFRNPLDGQVPLHNLLNIPFIGAIAKCFPDPYYALHLASSYSWYIEPVPYGIRPRLYCYYYYY